MGLKQLSGFTTADGFESRAQAIFYRISRLESYYGYYHIPKKDSVVAVAAVANPGFPLA